MAEATGSTGTSGAAGGFLAGVSAIQGIGGFITSYFQAQAQKAQASYQAKIQQMNAEIADVQAQQSVEQGNDAAVSYARQVRQVIGTQRANLGASGIALDSGTALDLQTQTAEQGAEDILTIKNNAWRQAWGYKVAAFTGRSQAQLDLLAGTNLSNSTLLTGGLNLVNGFAQAGYYASKAGGSSAPASSPASTAGDYIRPSVG